MIKSIRTSAVRRTVLALVLATGLAAVAPAAMAAVGFSSAGVQMVGLGATPLVARSISFGVHGAVLTGTAPQRAEVSELSVNRMSDANTPELMRLATSGRSLASLTFSLVANKNGVLTETQRVTITNVRVQGVVFATEDTGQASEAVSFAFDTIKMENIDSKAVLPWTYNALTNTTK